MKTQTKIAASLAMLLSSGLASAAPIPMKIDVGLAALPAGGQIYGAGGDANTVTGNFTQFYITQFLATSLYEKVGGLYTGAIFDTNNIAELTALGLPLPSYGQTTVSSLSPLTPPYGVISDAEGFGTTWGLVIEYNLIGSIPTDGTNFTGIPQYSGGTWDIYFDSYAAADGGVGGANFGHDKLVLSIQATGSIGEAPSLTINFDAIYALPGFFSVDGIDAASILPGLTMRLDAGVDPATPGPGDLVEVTNGTDTYGARPSDWDGSFSVRQVPEPSSIALLGLGFMGFAIARRKSAQSQLV